MLLRYAVITYFLIFIILANHMILMILISEPNTTWMLPTEIDVVAIIDIYSFTSWIGNTSDHLLLIWTTVYTECFDKQWWFGGIRTMTAIATVAADSIGDWSYLLSSSTQENTIKFLSIGLQYIEVFEQLALSNYSFLAYVQDASCIALQVQRKSININGIFRRSLFKFGKYAWHMN